MNGLCKLYQFSPTTPSNVNAVHYRALSFFPVSVFFNRPSSHHSLTTAQLHSTELSWAHTPLSNQAKRHCCELNCIKFILPCTVCEVFSVPEYFYNQLISGKYKSKYQTNTTNSLSTIRNLFTKQFRWRFGLHSFFFPLKLAGPKWWFQPAWYFHCFQEVRYVVCFLLLLWWSTSLRWKISLRANGRRLTISWGTHSLVRRDGAHFVWWLAAAFFLCVPHTDAV